MMDLRKIDALQSLQLLDDKSVDLVLTGPPSYTLLNIDWDKQWKTKDDYLNWLEEIVKETQRVLKDNGSFYMFASAEMSWYVENIIRKYFNVLNHIRWADKESMAKRCNKEELRRYINNSEEIIFAEQFKQEDLSVFEPIRAYLDEARIKANISRDETNKICNVRSIASKHYFSKSQWCLPTEELYNKLREHMDLKPYEEIKQEYEHLRITFNLRRRTFNLTAVRQYNNTWIFKQTPSRKGRHPCEKPEELINHIIETSSKENDVVVDMFCGSCVVPKCCNKMNRKCIAGDVDDKYFPP